MPMFERLKNFHQLEVKNKRGKDTTFAFFILKPTFWRKIPTMKALEIFKGKLAHTEESLTKEILITKFENVYTLFGAELSEENKDNAFSGKIMGRYYYISSFNPQWTLHKLKPAEIKELYARWQ